MTDALPQDIRRIALADGVLYRLPRRPLGVARWVGVFPLLFAGGVVMFAFQFLDFLPHVLWDKQGNFEPMGLSFLLIALPLAAMAAGPLFVGLMVIVGRSDVRVDHQSIRAVERVGPFWRSRRRRADRVSDLEVGSFERTGYRSGWFADLMQLGAIRCRCAGQKDLLLAWGYPADMMDALAHDVAEVLNDHFAAMRPDRRRVEVKATSFNIRNDDEDAGELRTDDGTVTSTRPRLIEQPIDSTAIIDRHDVGITITLPARGVWKGSHGLFPIGLFGVAMLIVGSELFLYNADANDVSLIGGVILAVLLAIPVGVMIAGINVGRRKAILDVVGAPPDAVLLISRESLFGVRQQEYPQSRIEHIHVGNSGVEVNDRPLKQLRIVLRDPDQTLKLFTGRPEDELRWLASELAAAVTPPAA